MPELLTNILTSDGYTNAATIGPAAGVEQLTFQAQNQPIYAQLYKPIPQQQGEPILELVERYFPANALVQFTNVCGARFRSALPGKPSTIVAELAFATDPISAYSATGLVSPSSPVPAITRQIFTVGPVGYVVPAGCTAILVECLGGGGGGGGAPATVAGQISVGAGASGGSYAASLLTVASLIGPFVVNVGFGGGAAVGAAGGDGDVSNFDDSGGAGFLVQAAGGKGGGAGAAGGAPLNGGIPGHGAAAIPSIGDVIIVGEPGLFGMAMNLTPVNGYGGTGGAGAGPYGGGGGIYQGGTGAGQPGEHYGGGGGGALRPPSAAAIQGGVGSDGIVVITEFYGG